MGCDGIQPQNRSKVPYGMRWSPLVGLWALATISGCMFKWPGTDSGEGGTSLQDADPPQVGFVYTGDVGTPGWTAAHERGRQHLDATVPGVDTHYAAGISPADAPDVLAAFIADGDDIIISTRPDLLAVTLTSAANTPAVDFLSVSATTATANLGGYSARMYQAWYLAGLAAGASTCTGHVGLVAAVAEPETVRHINAFALGVRASSPGASVELAWTGAWHDPNTEEQRAQDLIDHGADIIAAHTDTSALVQSTAGQTVQCQGTAIPVWSIGYADPDVCGRAADTCLTTVDWSWGPLYAQLVAAIRDGTWDPFAPEWASIQDDVSESIVGLSLLHPSVDAAVQATIDATRSELARAGAEHRPFEGPLLDTDGVERVSAGAAMSDAELRRMCWLVEGVVEVAEGATEASPATVPAGCEGDG